MVEQGGCFRDHCPHVRILAVQDPQRIGIQPAPAVFVQLGSACGKVGHQPFPISHSGHAGTERVDLQRDLADAEASPQPGRQADQLGVDVRAGHAVSLGADLMELAIAAFLRFLVAKHRSGIPQSLSLVVQQAVFDTSPHAAGGPFRAQGQTVAVAVGKRVHFLFDDIGDFADGTGEQFGFFDQRQTNFVIAIGRQHLAQGHFEVLPQRRFARQDVVHTANGLKLFGHE